MLLELKYSLDVQDGTFWMSFDDFLKHFIYLEVCMVKQTCHKKPWFELRKKLWVSLTPTPLIVDHLSSRENSASLSFLGDIPRRISCMFILHVTANSPVEIFFSCHQSNKARTQNGNLYFDMGVTVLRIEPSGSFVFVCSSGLAVERQLQTSSVLERGVYIVIPMTSGTKLKQYHLQRESVSASLQMQDSSAIQILGSHRERFSTLVEAAIDEIFDRIDTNGDGVSWYTVFAFILIAAL